MENHTNLCKIDENCHFFSLKWNLWITSSNSRHIPGFLFNLLNDDRQIMTAPSKNNREKVDLALKIGVFSVFCLHLPVQSSNLSFSIQKPSHVTNIHWKFQDFLPSSLGVIKVFHFTLRSEDSVVATRPDTQQDSRGQLGRGRNAKTARNSEIFVTDLPTYRHGKV